MFFSNACINSGCLICLSQMPVSCRLGERHSTIIDLNIIEIIQLT